jgi:hypothetical protein
MNADLHDDDEDNDVTKKVDDHDFDNNQWKLPTLNRDSKVQATSSSCTVEDGTSVARRTVKL